MKTNYYNYADWRSECTRQKYIIHGAYPMPGNMKARHRYAYDKNGDVVGEFIHDKRRSRGYLTYGKE